MPHAYGNRYTGFLQRTDAVPLRPHDPDLPLWCATLTPWGTRPALAVGGAGWDRAGAEAAGIGEAIERLQPYLLPGDAVRTGSFDRLPTDEPAIEPERWVLFHPEQHAQAGFPFEPLTRRTECRWICFRQALTGAPHWVPADLAFLYPRAGSRHTIAPGVSTGLTCGKFGQPVLLRGLQEVIERDAVVGAWWGRYPLEEWDSAGVLADLGDGVSARLRRPNLQYRCYRVATPFSAHVTLVTMTGDDHEGACFSIGSACRETRRASWRKALLEAVQGRHYVRYLKRERPQVNSRADLRDFADHAVYYSLHPERLAATVLARPMQPTADPAASGTEQTADLIARLGRDQPVLFRNLTPPGIAQLRDGWYVLRVLVPGLQPLHGDDQFPHLGGPLWAPRTPADWPAAPPHPFP